MARLDIGYSENYSKLTRQLTRIVTLEAASGRYANLKNPGNKAGYNLDLDYDRTVRFRIIVRPPAETVKGMRTLHLGHNEVLLFLHGEIEDGNLGMDFGVKGAKYRWALGELIGDQRTLTGVNNDFLRVVDRSKAPIRGGAYNEFVMECMSLLDRRIHVLRKVREMSQIYRYQSLSVF